MRDDVRDKCINLYLEKCRTEHNIAFFRWRENFSIDAKELVEKYTMKFIRSIEIEKKHIDNDDADEINKEIFGELNQDSDESHELNVPTTIMPIKQAKQTRFEAKAVSTPLSNRAKSRANKRKSILDLLRLGDEQKDGEIDDLDMIGISSPKTSNKSKKKRRLGIAGKHFYRIFILIY